MVQKAENAYFAERIVIDGTREIAASRRILSLLKSNHLVTIAVQSGGVQAFEVPFLDGKLMVASGAPHFALSSGAPLLPAFGYRDGSTYVVQIGEPIRLAGMKRDEACEHAGQELARQLGDYVRAHPKDWAGWYLGTYSEPRAQA